jgi:hypothetical protein
VRVLIPRYGRSGKQGILKAIKEKKREGKKGKWDEKAGGDGGR